MSEIIPFSNSELNCSIRTITKDGEPWFIAKDVCDALDLKNNRAAISHLEDDEKGVILVSTLGGDQTMRTVNESGLYALTFRSRKQEARQFKKWVTSEVLPSIRKKGGYMVAVSDETPEQTMARALLLANDTIKRATLQIGRLEETIEANAPKVLYADTVAGSKSSCLIGELAKLITQKGYKIGQNTLFSWLRDNHYLCTKGENRNLPQQHYVEQGLFEIKKGTRLDGDGNSVMTRTVKVTGKGQIYFVNKFLGKQPA